jgi:pimeloyl-ACP methyl ester carboxylesterase
VPTLVLVGAEDTVTPPELSQKLADAITDTELHVLAGAAHLSNIERPGDFNSAVEAFIDRAEAGA